MKKPITPRFPPHHGNLVYRNLDREVNLLIMLSKEHEAKERLMKKHGFQKNEVLDVEQVAAYVFDNQTISKMPVSFKEGMLVETFDEVINEMNDSNDDVYYTFQDEEED